MGQSISTIIHHTRKPQFDFFGHLPKNPKVFYNYFSWLVIVGVGMIVEFVDVGMIVEVVVVGMIVEFVVVWRFVAARNIGCGLPHPIPSQRAPPPREDD